LDERVKDSEWTRRVWSALVQLNVVTWRDLVRLHRHDFICLPNFGLKSINEVESALERRGLWLGMSDDDECVIDFWSTG
jgi:DNA-directed RNA polymerase alpha subunit